jgi:hypothetical protein
MKWSGDFRYNEFVSTAYIYATHQGGDFTNGCTGSCGGTWNDDIAWWALSAIYGGEVNGMNEPVKSQTANEAGKDWMFMANYTLHLMMQQWDPSTCEGGMFWSRDRSSNEVNIRDYKSAISNEQTAHIGALIYNHAKDTDALGIAKQAYNWTLYNLVDLNDYYVYDGIYATPDGCQVQKTSVSHYYSVFVVFYSITHSLYVAINHNYLTIQWAYHYGVMISAGVELHRATNDDDYIKHSIGFYKHWKDNFIKPDGTFFNYHCGTNVGSGQCKDPDGYQWPLYLGLSDLYNELPASQSALKTEIKSLMVAQGSKLVDHFNCNKETWNCIRLNNPTTATLKKPYTFDNGTSPRDQVEMLAYINAMVEINGKKATTARPTQASVSGPGSTEDNSQRNPNGSSRIGGGIDSMIMACAMVLVVSGWFVAAV